MVLLNSLQVILAVGPAADRGTSPVGRVPGGSARAARPPPLTVAAARFGAAQAAAASSSGEAAVGVPWFRRPCKMPMMALHWETLDPNPNPSEPGEAVSESPSRPGMRRCHEANSMISQCFLVFFRKMVPCFRKISCWVAVSVV